MGANKVQFNLKNVHYAILTEGTDSQTGEPTFSYGTPVAIPGAVSLSLAQVGEISKFYADGIIFYQTSSNNGYEGDLEVAKIPAAMLKDVWGLTEGTTSKVLTEMANVQPKAFALLFEIDGDADEECYVMYNCLGTRPDIASATTNETVEPQTMKTTISAAPRKDNKVFARTQADTPSTTKAGWFTSVVDE